MAADTPTLATRLVGGSVAALLLAACSSAGSWSEVRAAPTAGASATVAPPPTTGPPAQPSSSAGAEPTPSAANGTDVRACRKGRCEILVRGRVSVPRGPRVGVRAITVTFVPPDRNLFTGTDTQGGTFRGETGGLATLTADGVTIQVVAVSPTGAVLRFTPGPSSARSRCAPPAWSRVTRDRRHGSILDLDRLPAERCGPGHSGGGRDRRPAG